MLRERGDASAPTAPSSSRASSRARAPARLPARRSGSAGSRAVPVERERAFDERVRRAEIRRRVEQLVELRAVEVRRERGARSRRPRTPRRRARALPRGRASPRARTRRAPRRARCSCSRASGRRRRRGRRDTRGSRQPRRRRARARPRARPTPRARRRRRARARDSPAVSTPAAACTPRAHARAIAARVGFRFCGIVDEPPPAASATSPTSVWPSSTTSRPILSQRRRDRSQCVAELGDANAARVPRQHRLGETELGRERAQHVRPAVAERRKRSGRAAELRRQRGPRRAAPARPRTPTSQPAAFKPNVVGTACCSSVRPAIGVERCSSREPRARRRDRVELREDQLARAPRDEHRRGVDDVLARRAVMHPARRVAADARAKRADERLRRIADGAAGAGKLRHIELARAARACDPGRRVGRDHTCRRLRRGECALDFEHRLDPRAVRHRVAQRLGHEDRGEDGQCAKKTVCAVALHADVPAAARRPPPPRRASRGPRRRAPLSTGSAAFASASSGK